MTKEKQEELDLQGEEEGPDVEVTVGKPAETEDVEVDANETDETKKLKTNLRKRRTKLKKNQPTYQKMREVEKNAEEALRLQSKKSKKTNS